LSPLLISFARRVGECGSLSHARLTEKAVMPTAVKGLRRHGAQPKMKPELDLP
jgi:hypothetical protein